MKITQIVKKVKRKFISDGLVPPAIFIQGKLEENKCGILPLVFNDGYEKNIMNKAARKIIYDINPTRYFFVSEAWVSKNKNIRPSEAEDKKEIIHIVEYNKDLTVNIAIIPIINNKLGKVEYLYTRAADVKDIWNFYLEEC